MSYDPIYRVDPATNVKTLRLGKISWIESLKFILSRIVDRRTDTLPPGSPVINLFSPVVLTLAFTLILAPVFYLILHQTYLLIDMSHLFKEPSTICYFWLANVFIVIGDFEFLGHTLKIGTSNFALIYLEPVYNFYGPYFQKNNLFLRDLICFAVLPLLLSSVTSFLFCFKVMFKPQNGVERVSGRVVMRGEEATIEAKKNINSADLAGKSDLYSRLGQVISVKNGVVLSQNRARTGLHVVGATGSGKTTALRDSLNFVACRCNGIFSKSDKQLAKKLNIDKKKMERFCRAAIAKGIIYDPKPEFTEWLPGNNILLAPADKRSAIWDIANDVYVPESQEHTQTFCLRTAAMWFPVSEKDNPFFAESLTVVCAAVMYHLCKTRGRKWTWKTLKQMLVRVGSDADLQQQLLDDFPPAVHTINTIKSKGDDESVSETGESILSSIKDVLAIMHLFSLWWKCDGKRYSGDRKLFSMREFLSDIDKIKNKNDNLLILQRNPSFAPASALFTRSLLTIMIEIMQTMPDAGANGSNKNRRLYVCADEFQSLGALSYIQDGQSHSILKVSSEELRSKGVCWQVAHQNLAQLEKIYGKIDTEIMTGNLLTKLYMKLSAPDAKKVSDELGKVTLRLKNYSVSDGEKSDRISESWMKEEVQALAPANLTKIPNLIERQKPWLKDWADTGKSGYLVTTTDKTDDIYQLEFPFSNNYPTLREIRELQTTAFDNIEQVKIAVENKLINKKTPEGGGKNAKRDQSSRQKIKSGR